MQTRIDHLVIGAGNLTQGVDYVRNCLGVNMPYGIKKLYSCAMFNKTLQGTSR